MGEKKTATYTVTTIAAGQGKRPMLTSEEWEATRAAVGLLEQARSACYRAGPAGGHTMMLSRAADILDANAQTWLRPDLSRWDATEEAVSQWAAGLNAQAVRTLAGLDEAHRQGVDPDPRD